MRRTSVVISLVVASTAWAHGGHDASPKRYTASEASRLATPFGRPGVKATRTITLQMNDAMRFTPDKLSVRRGETIRFVVKNNGRLLHEMVLGTKEELAKHAELMKRFPDMEHDEPNMVHVKPGATGEMLWTFDKPGRFDFACLLPGHFDAGMFGTVVVE